MTDSITIFGDIHGNLPALEAVFEDMAARGLENLYCLGDLVGYGTFPERSCQLDPPAGYPDDHGQLRSGRRQRQRRLRLRLQSRDRPGARRTIDCVVECPHDRRKQGVLAGAPGAHSGAVGRLARAAGAWQPAQSQRVHVRRSPGRLFRAAARRGGRRRDRLRAHAPALSQDAAERTPDRQCRAASASPKITIRVPAT